VKTIGNKVVRHSLACLSVQNLVRRILVLFQSDLNQKENIYCNNVSWKVLWCFLCRISVVSQWRCLSWYWYGRSWCCFQVTMVLTVSGVSSVECSLCCALCAGHGGTHLVAGHSHRLLTGLNIR